MTMQWGESLEVRALAFCFKNIVSFSQETNVEDLCITLQSIGDVVAQVEHCFEDGIIIARFLTAIFIKHN
jgi:hypothetical protein